ncbi:phage shock protein A, PspA [Methylobacterium sp. 4-46]|uniref:PspA/IM30 family protein n=1 Tax=unclassified Methylobacterium TaxID=2615210 RepID=UPI000152DA09|nr:MULTISPECIES: PspA/IM30 family protein [Methylobacterium]ACA18921.1 phage shock protein A, PspA [Methylobacterium sp. 4-46]WFT78144.1 PspA/IM30 family protein [Methylobacterium nodulans]
MLRIFATLARGAAARACEDVLDQHALPLLEQQIREAAAALDGSRRALAQAMAQQGADAKREAGLRDRLADLETRAVAALAGGREDLAGEAAEAIAALEADLASLAEARAAFDREVEALRRTVQEGGRQLAELERGRRLAEAGEAVRRLRVRRGEGAPGAGPALAEAQATLRRLREKQAQEAAVAEAMTILDAAQPAGIAERLEEAGFGPRTRPNAAGVMERLRAKAAGAPAAS